MIYEITISSQGSSGPSRKEKTRRVELARDGAGWRCKLDGREFPVDAVSTQNGVLSILLDGQSYEVTQETIAGEINIVVGGRRFAAAVRDPRSLRARRSTDSGAAGPKRIIAPMPGKVVRILVPVGSPVEVGQAVLVIEAMKMQNELKSPKKGTVKKINVSEGAAVEAGQALAEVE